MIQKMERFGTVPTRKTLVIGVAVPVQINSVKLVKIKCDWLKRKKKLHKDLGKQRENARNRMPVSMLVVFETDMTPTTIVPFLLVNFGSS